jgi:hypothetical protein
VVKSVARRKKNRDRFPVGTEIFLRTTVHQTVSGAHLGFCPMITCDPFLGDKAVGAVKLTTHL